MSKLMGVISHRKLMELKNSGTLRLSLLEDKIDDLYDMALSRVEKRLLEVNAGFCWQRLWFYNERMAKIDARIMFSDAEEMSVHLLALHGNSMYIPLSRDEADDFLFTNQALLAAQVGAEVIELFRCCNEVIADSNTAFFVDWLIQNSTKIRNLTSGGEDE